MSENLCCGELDGSFSYQSGFFLGSFESKSYVFGGILEKRDIFSVLIFHLFSYYQTPKQTNKQKLWMKCKVVELESWKLLTVLDGLCSTQPGSLAVPCTLPGVACCCWLVSQYGAWKQKGPPGATTDAAETAVVVLSLCGKLGWKLCKVVCWRCSDSGFYIVKEAYTFLRWFLVLCFLSTQIEKDMWRVFLHLCKVQVSSW